MASTGEAWRLGRRPALDGVRGVAILLVVIAHVHTPAMPFGGIVGVTLFFVLSGFLITRLLLREVDQTGRIGFAVFYARRARRLFPALAVVLLATPVLMWAVGDPRLSEYPRWAASVVFYVGDYARATGEYLGPLSHTWSLAVEEQFYMLWPLLLLGLVGRLRPERLAAVLWVAAVVALDWRLVAEVLLGNQWAYFALDTNAFGLLLGAALAAQERSTGLPRVGVVWPLAALVLLAAAPLTSGVRFVAPLAALLGVALVLAGCSAGGVLAHPLLRWFGLVSYGWYLWHQMLMTLLYDGLLPGLGGHLVAAVVSLGLAWLSLRYVEQPFLRRQAPSFATRSSHRVAVSPELSVEGPTVCSRAS